MMKHAMLLCSVAAAAAVSSAAALAIAPSLPAGRTVASAQPAQPKPAPTEDRVGFPEGYQTNYEVLFVFDRPDNKQVRVIYGNEQAAAANPSAPPNEVFPYGSILVMETYRAKLDEAGNPLLDANGRYQRDQLTGIFVQRKEPGFGEAYDIARGGEWEYVAFRPDGTYQTPPQNTNACAVCHQDAGATKDWVFRANLYFYGLSGAVPQTPPGLAETGRAVMQAYLFLPDALTVKRGATVTWANEDEIAHTVTAPAGAFDSGRLGPSTLFAHTFDQPGTFEYVCTLHSAMKGRVVVEE